MAPISQYTCLLLNCLDYLHLDLLGIFWFLALEFGEWDYVQLLGSDQLLRIEIDKPRFVHIFKNGLLELRVLIRILNRCKRDDFPLPNFLKILKDYILPISTDHTNHLINLFLRKLFPEAFQKESDIIERQYSIFIDIYHFECLSYLFIGI
jgi:hypothetical protein